MTSRLSYWQTWLLIALVVLAAPAAWRASRHWNTYWYPVVVTMDAPANTQARLAWGDGIRESVPVVRGAIEKAPVEWWAILPPVEVHGLRLVVKATGLVRPSEITIDCRGTGRPDLRFPLKPSSGGGEGADVHVYELADVHLNNPSFSKSAFVAGWSALVGCGYLLLVLLLAPLRRRQNSVELKPAPGRLTVWSGLVVAAVSIIHALAIPGVYTGGDSNSFLWKAATIAAKGTFDTGSYAYELNKLPGYPFAIALLNLGFGFNLSALLFFQHAMYAGAVWALGWRLRHKIGDRWAALSILALGLAPVQLFYCSVLLSESLMAALLILAVIPLLNLESARGRREWINLAAFSVLLASASMMRINSLLLALSLIPIYLDKYGLHIRSIPPLLVRVSVVTVVSVGPAVAWSFRNLESRGLLAPQDMNGVQRFHGSLVGGFFDPTASAFGPYYGAFCNVLSRRGALAWPLRQIMFDRAGQSPAAQFAAVRAIDARLAEISVQSATLHRSAYHAAIVRSLALGIFMPDGWDRGSQVRNGPHSSGYPSDAYVTTAVQSVKYADARYIYDVRSATGFFFRVFQAWNKTYLVLYDALVGLATLVLVLWSLKPRRSPVGVGLALFFLSNIFFMALLVTPYGRYIQVLDFALVLSAVLLLSGMFSSGANPDRLQS